MKGGLALAALLVLSPLAPALSVEPHGDPLPPFVRADLPSAQPACAQEDAFHVLWVIPPATLDTFEARAPAIRAALAAATGIVRESALPHGVDVRLRFLCQDDGQVLVSKVRVPTRALAATFTTIVRDVQAQGYDRPDVKYWIVYDAENLNCPDCVGQGHIHADDRLAPDNANNAGAMYAVTYLGNFGGSATVGLLADAMLHEAAHTMGAVQRSAPHATAWHHCEDGADVMCYPDGAPDTTYTPLACPRGLVAELGPENPFDCGNDDYFHPAPAPATYLATHWNLGSPLNRYIEWRPLSAAPP